MRPLRWLAAGVLLVALIRATGVNRNLLYLSLVFAVYLIVATIARSPAVLAVALLFRRC